jgi:3-methyl-2-oxobutanoate hydroxymethyltransferase
MPFMSYQTSPTRRCSARAADEGGRRRVGEARRRPEIADVIRRIVRMGIPVMGHVGLMPQRVHAMGGFKVQGRSDEAAPTPSSRTPSPSPRRAPSRWWSRACPAPLAERITNAIDVPTIGIGAGVGLRRADPRELRPARAQRHA